MRFANLTRHGGHFAWGLVSWAAAEDLGTCWLGILRFRAILKAPWREPLFSERYGRTTTLRLGKGWRITFRLA